MNAAKLRPASGVVACKVCGGDTRLLGVCDFNRSCEDARTPALPLSGVAIYYRVCGGCGLCFTDAFDDWSQAAFEAHIYNGDYGRVDPDHVSKRPEQNAIVLGRAFSASAGRLAVLDYGGGNGRFAELAGAAGFDCVTYDPFNPAFAARPGRRFDLVTCFETLEHMPDPVAGVADLADLLADDGVVLFTTLVQPAEFGEMGMRWWYIGPRNGHVTLFSRTALAQLFRRFGLSVASFNDNAHLAYRGALPAFAAHLTAARGI